MTDVRRLGVAVLLVVLAGGALLAALPSVGVVRLGGLTLRWWLGGLVGPVLVAVATALPMPGAGGWMRVFAAWTGPALVAVLVGHVAAGDPATATIALLACAAPLLVVAATPWAPPPPAGALARALGGLALALVLAADLAAAADVVGAAGVDRRAGVLAAAVLAAATLAVPRGTAVRSLALAAGAAGLAIPLAAVGAGAGITPWVAWAGVAERPAIVFGAQSPWVIEGRPLAAPTTLVFGEPHRITAMGAATWRVVEREDQRAAVRDWQLTGGESFELRSGDVLMLPSGTRVRMEAGRRVPGAPPSGTTWAEQRPASGLEGLAGFVGALVTLAGGAWLLVGSSRGARVRASAGPVLLAAVVATATSWGTYTAFAGADVVLGAPPIAALVRVPRVLAAWPWPPALVAGALLGIAALGLAAADALRERVAALAGGGPGRGRALWCAAIAMAAMLALSPADAWHWLVLGCGAGATAWAAPALAARDPRARAAGTVAGVIGFAVLAAGVTGVEAWLPVVGTWPALAAAPLAWGVTRALAR